MSSVYVVCWIFLQTSQSYFFAYWQTVWTQIRLLLRSSLIWVHTVCRNDFQNHKQKTKQTTIVVIGALRIKDMYQESFYNIQFHGEIRNNMITLLVEESSSTALITQNFPNAIQHCLQPIADWMNSPTLYIGSLILISGMSGYVF